ncbi:hypothetical protein MLD38_035761 [Melastoma candidum]|uniref:Uncharacterized protein n=1 Tax=Melastoma candidum TaxID=119954 RepID=A0ACB9LH40_9MYRT|nr:hypothetical protein MLD38_035761 [Melastoma candidum]
MDTNHPRISRWEGRKEHAEVSLSRRCFFLAAADVFVIHAEAVIVDFNLGWLNYDVCLGASTVGSFTRSLPEVPTGNWVYCLRLVAFVGPAIQLFRDAQGVLEVLADITQAKTMEWTREMCFNCFNKFPVPFRENESTTATAKGNNESSASMTAAQIREPKYFPFKSTLSISKSGSMLEGVGTLLRKFHEVQPCFVPFLAKLAYMTQKPHVGRVCPAKFLLACTEGYLVFEPLLISQPNQLMLVGGGGSEPLHMYAHPAMFLLRMLEPQGI